MSEMLTIRLSEKLAQALRNEARETGLSKGEIARRALENRFDSSRQDSPISRYFGIMDGPADLSVSKAYRKNWGKKGKM